MLNNLIIFTSGEANTRAKHLNIDNRRFLRVWLDTPSDPDIAEPN